MGAIDSAVPCRDHAEHRAAYVDPATANNVHHIEVESDSANLRMSIENLPTVDPRTVRITARSVIALLRKMTATLRIGT